ncbi:MAG: dihydroneopterin aldolase [Bacteroidota bacterium]
MSDIGQYLQTVALKDVKYYGFHGFYPEEQLTGIYFLIDVTVSFKPNNDTENINNTVNYERLNSIIIEEMVIPKKMLETVVDAILKRVLKTYDFLTTAEVQIRKLNPPMPGEVGQSLVKLTYNKQ